MRTQLYCSRRRVAMRILGKSKSLVVFLVAAMMVTSCAMPTHEQRAAEERAIEKTGLVGGTTGTLDPGTNTLTAEPLLIDPEWTGEETNPPPRDPTQPRMPGLRTLAVEILDLELQMRFLLGGTRIALDATHTGPYVVQGTTRVCRRESEEAYQAARLECLHLTSGRGECLRQLNEDYPVVCRNYSAAYWSFLSFTDELKQLYPSLTDYVYDLNPFVRDTWHGEIKVTINKIMATLGRDNLDVSGGRDRLHEAYIALGADMVSGSPTAYCEHLGYFTCQNIQLSNMHIVIRLQGLKRDPAEPTRVAFSTVGVRFSFDRNINNVPDWLITPFFDIDKRIQKRVHEKIQTALADQTRRDTISKAITTILNQYGRQNVSDWTGFKIIDEVTCDHGKLYVHYIPN